MGADPLSRKRRAKKPKDLARSKARRAPYAKVLIVCEGEKTEPRYFKDLKDHYELNTANVEICGNCGSDPVSIIEHAKKRYHEEKEAGDGFDRVFCVFDKDAHASYLKGLDAIRGASPKGLYVAITSIPCFEYWLLLHFKYTTKPYGHLPGKSACEQVQVDLKLQCRITRKATEGHTKHSATDWRSPSRMRLADWMRRRRMAQTTRLPARTCSCIISRASKGRRKMAADSCLRP